MIERIGGRAEIAVDVRVCATHRDLPALIQQGDFREDLYYRISEATIRVPPLRERQGDNLLARAFSRTIRDAVQTAGEGFMPQAVEALSRPITGPVTSANLKTGSNGQ